MTDTFRVLIGRSIDSDLNGARYESTHPTWQAARDHLAAEFRQELDDAQPDENGENGCPFCVTTSQAALDGLNALTEGSSYSADIDGCDYVLAPATTSA